MKFDEDCVLYLEMSNAGIAQYGHRYLSIRPRKNDPLWPISKVYMANRVWKHDTKTNEIKFIKNRFIDPESPVDMREFFLVQIASTPIGY